MGAQRGRLRPLPAVWLRDFVSNFSGGAFTHGWNFSAGRLASAAAGRLVGRVRSLTVRAVPLRWASLAKCDNVIGCATRQASAAAGRLVERLRLQLFGRCVHARLELQRGAAGFGRCRPFGWKSSLSDRSGGAFAVGQLSKMR